VVAIKVLSKQIAASEIFVQRFQREVEAVARLTHPNIVMAFDADEAEVGHFLVMEFVNGQNLDTLVRERGPLPLDVAIDAVIQSARAMDYAHEQGVIHRDIKPANLLRDRAGVVKVADLGLAAFSDAAEREASGITRAGTIMGTADYMPPEQSLGMRNVDQRADIYSLGCTLYFLLTGRPPYAGPSLMAILLKHREAPIPALCERCPNAPAKLEGAFGRMVAKRPEDRYAAMSEVIDALLAISSTLARPSGSRYGSSAGHDRPERRAGRHGRAAGGAVGGAFADAGRHLPQVPRRARLCERRLRRVGGRRAGASEERPARRHRQCAAPAGHDGH
jgi:serine/threonine-protein kinase